MVASYKDKFIKVFLSSILLISLVVVFLIQIYKYTAGDSVEILPDHVLFIGKYLLPPVAIVAQGLYLWSHYLLAKAKGYSGWLALLGFINTFGILILFLLPDRSKTAEVSKRYHFLRKVLIMLILLFIVFCGFLTYYLYKEDRENDRLPKILSNQVKMEVLSEFSYDSSKYLDGNDCTPIKKEAVLKAVGRPDVDQFYTCEIFPTEKGNFYLLEENLSLLVILEKSPEAFELIIEESKKYPGINDFRMKGSKEDILFIYKGYNNPRKTIRLTVN